MSHTVDKPDMGYTTGFYDGQKAEHERIIKLLDEYKGFFRTIEGGELIDYSEHAIALIKGESL